MEPRETAIADVCFRSLAERLEIVPCQTRAGDAQFDSLIFVDFDLIERDRIGRVCKFGVLGLRA